MRRTLTLMLVAFIFGFTVSKCKFSMPVSEKEEKITEAIKSINENGQEIDSIVMMDLGEGDMYECVYYANGEEEIFGDYLNIKDIPLRKVYMTYRGIYWNGKGDPSKEGLLAISRLSPQELYSLNELQNDHEELYRTYDYYLFNYYLVTHEMYAMSFRDYSEVIAGDMSIMGTNVLELIAWVLILLVILGFLIGRLKKLKSNTS